MDLLVRSIGSDCTSHRAGLLTLILNHVGIGRLGHTLLQDTPLDSRLNGEPFSRSLGELSQPLNMVYFLCIVLFLCGCIQGRALYGGWSRLRLWLLFQVVHELGVTPFLAHVGGLR